MRRINKNDSDMFDHNYQIKEANDASARVEFIIGPKVENIYSNIQKVWSNLKAAKKRIRLVWSDIIDN